MAVAANDVNPFLVAARRALQQASDEYQYTAWRAWFSGVWQQGEHVALIGPTGSGKTFVASDILPIRTYVIALSIKPHDDTLARFSRADYKRVRAWPVDYDVNRALFVAKPSRLGDRAQAGRVYALLNGVSKSTGWTVFLDDVAYLVNTLKLRQPVVEFLNVGRSSGITTVAALQQPTSVSANVPSELKKQVQHVLAWRMTGDDEIEATGRIMGVKRQLIHDMMGRLRYYDAGHNRYTDFIYYRRGYDPWIIRV